VRHQDVEAVGGEGLCGVQLREHERDNLALAYNRVHAVPCCACRSIASGSSGGHLRPCKLRKVPIWASSSLDWHYQVGRPANTLHKQPRGPWRISSRLSGADVRPTPASTRLGRDRRKVPCKRNETSPSSERWPTAP
jgi:hypothetical protein